MNAYCMDIGFRLPAQGGELENHTFRTFICLHVGLLLTGSPDVAWWRWKR